MANEEKTSKTISFRVPPEIAKEWEELIQHLGADNKMVENISTIIDRVYTPIKVNAKSEKIISGLEAEKKELQLKLDSSEKELSVLKDENLKALQQLSDENKVLKDENESLQGDKLPENGMVIILDPLNLKLLQYVAARESKERKQNWTVDDVLNFYICQWFEKGNPNGSLDNVPDRIVRELKAELNG